VHAGQVLGDEGLDLRRGQVIGNDADRHWRRLCCETFELTGVVRLYRVGDQRLKGARSATSLGS
jgi:hypothetical protein